MAEERLIDDDKDKKYRIKINEDGEQELVIDESQAPQEVQPVEEVSFEAPENYEQDEEAASLTPEQYAQKLEQLKKDREERRAKACELVKNAEKDAALEKYATALEYLAKAEELDSENGDIYALRMAVYTRDFTDFEQITDAAESAEGVKKYTTAEVKHELYKKAEKKLEENIAKLRGKVKSLNDENEKKKAERAVKFTADRNKAIIIFGCIFALFAASVSLCGYFASIIYTVSTGLYLALTITFAAVSFVLIIACAFAARNLLISLRRLKMNGKNTSTSLGRELLEQQARLKAFIDVRDSLKD